MSEMYTLKGYLLCFDKWRTCLLWWFFEIAVLILWHVQHVGKLHAVRISEVALNLGWFWSMWNLWCRYTLLKHLLEDFAQVCEYLGANIEGNDFGSCLCRVFLSICLSVSKPFQYVFLDLNLCKKYVSGASLSPCVCIERPCRPQECLTVFFCFLGLLDFCFTGGDCFLLLLCLSRNCVVNNGNFS